MRRTHVYATRGKCPVQHKKQYFTREEAEQSVLTMYKQGYTSLPLGFYKCPNCLYWHLTSEYDNATHRMRAMLHKAAQKKVVNRKEKQVRKNVKILEQAQMKEALAKLHNKPAGLWLRVKHYLRQLV